MKQALNQFASSPLGSFAVLAVAASLEVLGDSFFQSGLYHSTGPQRSLWFLLGIAVLGLYGLFVNLPQWDFGKLLGVYVALFFLVADRCKASLRPVSNHPHPCRRWPHRRRRSRHHLLEALIL